MLALPRGRVRLSSKPSGPCPESVSVGLRIMRWSTLCFGGGGLALVGFSSLNPVSLTRGLSPAETGEGASLTGYSAAEPVGARRILLLGSGDAADVQVTMNGVALEIADTASYLSPARTYLTLGSRLDSGTLEIQSGDRTFTRVLKRVQARLNLDSSWPISPDIYGLAFAEPEQVDTLGLSLGRWGGNTTSTYNPVLKVENAGADWYFENRSTLDADAWVGALAAAGATASLTLPALDFVARDNTSYSYSVGKYGPQESTDPWKPDAGNGLTPEGEPILHNDPADAFTPWTPELAAEWLRRLPVKPALLAIDNELDISSATHQDIHPVAMSYDELLSRFISSATVAREALPTSAITGPVSCCWWFYWNSAMGWEDKAAHEEMDFLPWFLEELAWKDFSDQVRRLDYLDIHFYPDAAYNSKTDPQTRALRLRSTRSLWDPSYIDESWIGTDDWATQSQPNPNAVALIPRMRTLVAATYPETMLYLSEYSWGGEDDLSGWLALADILGIFGRERLDAAAYWTWPSEGEWPGVIGAFKLFRDPFSPFGSTALALEALPDPDLVGLFPAQTSDGSLTFVLVNKDPQVDLIVELDGLPQSGALVRRFGGSFGMAMFYDPDDSLEGVLVAPAYSAVFAAPGQTGIPLEPAEGGGCRFARGASCGPLIGSASLLSFSWVGFWWRRRRRRA